MRKTARLLVLSLSLAVIAGCGGSKPSPGSSQSQQKAPSAITAMAKMANIVADPIAQMSLEFDGNPSKDKIREKIDKALMMYGLEANNDNRSSAGRVLVELRKEHGHSEMAILEKMLNSPAEGKFEDAAAKISAAMNQ